MLELRRRPEHELPLVLGGARLLVSLGKRPSLREGSAIAAPVANMNGCVGSRGPGDSQGCPSRAHLRCKPALLCPCRLCLPAVLPAPLLCAAVASDLTCQVLQLLGDKYFLGAPGFGFSLAIHRRRAVYKITA